MQLATHTEDQKPSLSKQSLIDQFTPYVKNIAKQVKKTLPPRIELDDLVGYGMTGLIEAADRFDAKHGANFSTFSYYRIRGAIYDGLRHMGWIGRSDYQRMRFEERANAYLENRAARQPCGSASSAPKEQLGEMAQQVGQLFSIYVTSLEGMGDVEFEDKTMPRQDNQFEGKQLKMMLRKAMSQLAEADRKLIELYYFCDFSLEEAGKELGLSKSWMCRRHAQAIEKLSIILRKVLKDPV